MIGWSLTRASVPTPYSAGVIAITLEQAQTIAVVATTALVVGAIASFWVMKTVVQKLLVAGLLGLLAFAVWTQRASAPGLRRQGAGQLHTIGNHGRRDGHRVLLLRTVDHDFGPTSGVNTLVRLTGAKTVANTALRWIPLFLPTLERAFGATTTQLTTVIGAGELAGFRRLRPEPGSTADANES